MRRRSLIIVLAVALMGIFCATYSAAKPRSTKAPAKTSANTKNEHVLDETNCFHGIDISHHNSGINWPQLEVDFVYLKATEGATHVDSKFHQYRDSCIAYDIPVGAYHFFTTSSTGKAQFNNFKATIGNTTNLIPVIDIEINKGKWSRKKLNSEIMSFIRLCRQEYGVTPMIYTSDYFYSRYFRSTEVDGAYLWLGDVDVKQHKLKNPHVMHQFTIGKVKGVNYKVDRNALYVPIDSISMPSSNKRKK